MALTATATNVTRKEVIKHLSMNKPVIVYVPPIKQNISYIVRKRKDDELERLSKSLASSLQQDGVNAPRIIVFCRRYKECAQLYHCIKQLMGADFTKPAAMPDLHRFRLVEMYCRCTEQELKEKIVTSFTKKDSQLRLVIATISFGMGLDCPNVRLIVHYGPSENIEDYVQETGRGGRDGGNCCTLLLYCGRDNQHTKKAMLSYCKNESECRRVKLFSNFPDCDKPAATLCQCCDICCSKCQCGHCSRLSLYSTCNTVLPEYVCHTM